MKKTAFAILLIAILIALTVVGVIAYASDWFTLPTEQWGERFEREDIPDNDIEIRILSMMKAVDGS